MERHRRALIAAVVATGLTLLGLYRLDQSRAGEAEALRAEIETLQTRARDATGRAPAEEGPAPGAAPAAVAAVKPTAQAPVASPAPAPVPIYRNEGRATARAMLQTFAWATDRGDLSTVRSMLVFDPAARVKAEHFFASVSPEVRQTWVTIEHMAAALLTESSMAAPFPSYDVLDAIRLEELRPDRVRMHFWATHRDGWEFQHTPDGWSLAITETMVDGYLQRMGAAAK